MGFFAKGRNESGTWGWNKGMWDWVGGGVSPRVRTQGMSRRSRRRSRKWVSGDSGDGPAGGGCWWYSTYVYSRRQGVVGIVVMKKCFFGRWLDGVATVR